MEKLLLVVALIQVFSYNLLNLGSDLGILNLKSIIETNPDGKYYKLQITDIRLSKEKNYQAFNISTCFNTREIQNLLDKASINKMQHLIEQFSSKSECIVYFFMRNSINYLQDQNLSSIYYKSHYKLENIYLENCNSRNYSQALALFRYFSQNTNRDKFISYIDKISSIYNFEKFNDRGSQYYTKIHLVTNLDCQKTSGLYHSFSGVFICWIEKLFANKFPLCKNILDQLLRYMDIKKPNCEEYNDNIEEIIKMNFRWVYETYKNCEDIIEFLKAIPDYLGIDIPGYVWSLLGFMKDGTSILFWPLKYFFNFSVLELVKNGSVLGIRHSHEPFLSILLYSYCQLKDI